MISLDRAAFFAGYRAAFGRLTQAQVVGLDLKLGFIEADPLPDIRWIAYYLATVKHECGDTWMPVTEYGNRAYFQKYEPGTKIGRNLGNTLPGDGFLFRGRGDVQLTGRPNYEKMGELLKLDLVGNPDLAKVPLHAYQIASIGMARGLFTGKKLADYLNSEKTDWVNSRRIINGLDKARLIAGYAEAFYKILQSSLRPIEAPQEPVASPPVADPSIVVANLRTAISLLQQALEAAQRP